MLLILMFCLISITIFSSDTCEKSVIESQESSGEIIETDLEIEAYFQDLYDLNSKQQEGIVINRSFSGNKHGIISDYALYIKEKRISHMIRYCLAYKKFCFDPCHDSLKSPYD